jgi:hypothetical protein
MLFLAAASRIIAAAFLLLSVKCRESSAFVATTQSASTTRRPFRQIMSALPTADQVSTDDFMKQLGHASQLIPILHPDDEGGLSDDESAEVLQLLTKQFAHSDGIRGFFAVYLTSPESLNTDEVPSVLAKAVKGSDMKVMVPLACMNVIMPTAMKSIHQDEELKECASQTAQNGLKILRLLKGDRHVIDNCQAINQVASNEEVEEGDDLVEYWDTFFTNYKYGSIQKADISQVIQEFC